MTTQAKTAATNWAQLNLELGLLSVMLLVQILAVPAARFLH